MVANDLRYAFPLYKERKINKVANIVDYSSPNNYRITRM